MGIGQREFIRLAGLALGGLAINPLQAVLTTDESYINKKLGIMFQKPAGWGFVHVKDFGRLRDEQRLGEGWDEIKDEVVEEPICIVTKYHQDRPEYHGIFSPTITLHITPKAEIEPYGHKSFESVLAISEFVTAQMLRDFSVTRRYEPYDLNGNLIYEYDAEYLFEHAEISEPLRAELKCLKTEHNGLYYDFNCHQSSAQNQLASAEFEAFKRTIKLI